MKISNQIALGLAKNLAQQSDSLSDIFTRLATGQRINRASDDAAGLNIASVTDFSIRVANQGIRNINDGISLVSIADAAAGELSGILERMSELASQAANGAYSSTQREAMDTELQDLKSEYNRIIESTKYNGISILEDDSSTVLQGGVGVASSLSIATDLNTDAQILVGSGSYQAASTFSGSISLADLHLADINGDGNLDMIMIDGPLMIRTGDGQGSFNVGYTYSSGASGAEFGAVADIDNDGDQDIIIAHGSSDTVVIHSNNGSGLFSISDSFNSANGANEVAVGDFNEDGFVDLVVASPLSPIAELHLGNGDGTFNTGVTIDQQEQGRTLKTADIDGDGNLDLVFGRDNGNSIHMLFGDGLGNFSAVVSIVADNDAEIELADVNGDNLLDIIAVSTSEIAVFQNQGLRSFTQNESITIADGAGIDSADFNQDGFADLAVSTDSGSSILVYSGASDGSLTLTDTRTSSVNLQFAEFGDITSDGVLDLIGYSIGSDRADTFIGDTEIGSVNLLTSIDISTQSNALEAISSLSLISDALSQKRGVIGANLARLDTFVSQLQSSSLLLKEAKSRIVDIDIALESSKLIRTSIQQQATTSLLAQANLDSRLVLKLLQ